MRYYRSFTEQEQPVNKGGKCKHGLDEKYCSICQGTIRPLKKKRFKYVTLP